MTLTTARILKPVFLALSLLSANALAVQIQGKVFLDRNKNGVQDAGERGVANVAVSNGRTVVNTSAAGTYHLDVEAGEIVFVIKPAGFAVPARQDGMPAFWHAHQPTPGPALRYGGLLARSNTGFDFPLYPQAPQKQPGSRLLIFADPQAKQTTDVGYYWDDVVKDVQAFLARHPGAYTVGTSLGDIVNDDLSLYPTMNAVTANMGVPWLHIPGNHDIDMDAQDDQHALDTYRNTFGPDTFAWNERDFTFIGLDNVIWRGAPTGGYVGGFRREQLAFLQAYLTSLPADRMLVLGLHIPLFEADGKDTFRDEDRAALYALLERFKHVLVLSAHNHTQQHVFHDGKDGWHGQTPLHEYNVGAVCGAFWSGVKDAQGIPASTMADGTPNGWATLETDAQGHYALNWHVARDPSNPAMHLSGPATLRKGAYPAWGIYANAYMAAADTRLEFKVDNGPWKAMQRVTRPDPALVAENMRDDAAQTLRGYDRSPEAQDVAHLWRGALPTDLAVGAHVVTVRFTDSNGRAQTATRTYTLQEAAP